MTSLAQHFSAERRSNPGVASQLDVGRRKATDAAAALNSGADLSRVFEDRSRLKGEQPVAFAYFALLETIIRREPSSSVDSARMTQYLKRREEEPAFAASFDRGGAKGKLDIAAIRRGAEIGLLFDSVTTIEANDDEAALIGWCAMIAIAASGGGNTRWYS